MQGLGDKVIQDIPRNVALIDLPQKCPDTNYLPYCSRSNPVTRWERSPGYCSILLREIAACILDDPNEEPVYPGRSLPKKRSMQVITHLLMSEAQASKQRPDLSTLW